MQTQKYQPSQFELINQINESNQQLIRNPNSIPDLLNRASSYQLLNQLQQAQIDYEAVVNIEKNNLQALFQLAFVAEALNDISSTVKYCERVLELEPNNQVITFKLASYDVQHQKIIIDNIADFKDPEQIDSRLFAQYQSLEGIINVDCEDDLFIPPEHLIRQALGIKAELTDEQLLSQAQQLFSDSKFAETTAICSKLIQKNVLELHCLQLRAQCHIQQNDEQSLQNAYIDLRRALQFDPRNERMLLQMAQILQNLNKNSEALVFLRQAALTSQRPELHVEKARLEIATGDIQQAIMSLSEALRLKFTVEALQMRAQVKVKAEQYQEALADYELLLQSRRTPEDLKQRAAILMQLNQFERANSDLIQAHQLDGAPETLRVLVNNYVVMNDATNALKFSQQLLDTDGLSEANAALRAGAFKLAKNYQKALELYQKVGDLSQAGYCYRKLGFYKEAAAEYSKLEKLNAKELVNRAFCFARTKKYMNAIQDYTDAIADEPAASSYYNRGICYQSLGMKDEAVKDLKRCLDLEPDNEQAIEALQSM